jgi:small GTP-binding protein
VYVDEAQVRLDISDASGCPISSIIEYFIRIREGFIVVYSVTDRHSFEQVNQYIDAIKSNNKKASVTLPIILVGNKIDLEDDRVVSYEEGKELAKDCKIPLFMESSAKTNENIEQIFFELIRLCRKFISFDSNAQPSKLNKCQII